MSTIYNAEVVSAPADLPSPLLPLFSRPDSSIPLIPQVAFSPSLSVVIISLSRQEGWKDALTAALHLLNDDTTKAHDIVTDRDDCEACNLVHALLHRREGDYWNAKYWYSRLSHPFFLSFYSSPSLSSSSSSSLSTARDSAKKFVDEVQSLTGAGGRGTTGMAVSACGAKNLLARVKSCQERELKGLVRWLWEHRNEDQGGI